MELEEAIKRVKDLIEDNKQYFEKTLNKDDADIQDRLKKDNEAIETVLKELDVLKFKYQARKDRTDTIIKKQEKMIELMVQTLYDEDYEELICMEVDCEHIEIRNEGKCIGKDCIREYFEKKAEEKE